MWAWQDWDCYAIYRIIPPQYHLEYRSLSRYGAVGKK